MNREEYLGMLATEPLTPAQRGAILAEFGRLGITDRAERLSISAALLGRDSLGSTTDLVMGEAGSLIAVLRDAADRAQLAGLAADGQGAIDARVGRGWVMLLARYLSAFCGPEVPGR